MGLEVAIVGLDDTIVGLDVAIVGLEDTIAGLELTIVGLEDTIVSPQNKNLYACEPPKILKKT